MPDFSAVMERVRSGRTPGFNPEAPLPGVGGQPAGAAPAAPTNMKSFLLQFLLSQQAQAAQAAQTASASRDRLEERVAKAPKDQDIIDTDSPAMQVFSKLLPDRYAELAELANVDPEAIADERMTSRSPMRVFLRDMLGSMHSKTYTPVREKLAQRERQKQATAIGQMTSMGQLIQQLVASDVRRDAVATTRRGQDIGALETGAKLDAGADQSMQEFLRDLVGKQLEPKTPGQSTITTQLAKDAQSYETPFGPVVREGNFVTDKFSGQSRFVPTQGRKPRIELDDDVKEARRYAERLATSSRLASKAVEDLTGKGGDTRIATFLEKIRPATGVLGMTSEFFDDLLGDAGLLEGTAEVQLTQELKKVILSTVQMISGKQVTDRERVYIERTLPDMIANPRTFQINLELYRITAELAEARYNNLSVGASGTTKYMERLVMASPCN